MKLRRSLLVVIAFLAVAATVPLYVQGYWLRVLTSMFMYGILAESVNLIAGYAGYPALGNIVFFGTGAYITAVSMSVLGFPFFIALPLAGVACAFYATIAGLPILRLTGRYFLMATIGLAEVSREVVTNLAFTGGGRGITLPVLAGTPAFIYSFFYYLMLGVLGACIIVVLLIENNRLGFALRAIKFDEDAAGVMGIPTTKYKIIAWAISAFFTGLAGAVFAYWMTYIEPPIVFEIATSVKMYLMFIFGGAGTVIGPILGAFFIELLSELVWGQFLELHYLVLGAVVVMVVAFMPQGVAQLLRRYSIVGLYEQLVGYKVNKQISGQ